jgi:hypothetical protein
VREGEEGSFGELLGPKKMRTPRRGAKRSEKRKAAKRRELFESFRHACGCVGGAGFGGCVGFIGV